MQAENWQIVKSTLLEALSLDSSRRVDFLKQAALTGEQRREVESLLAIEENAGDFLSVPAGKLSKDFFRHEADDAERKRLVGQPVGNYKIISELGCGGMGAVYLAERTDGKFEQKAAIKMLRREFNSERIRRVFRREREIQAKLNHPNIARLLDAGTTDDGVPFLVMEYVEGLPVDEFCASENLSLKERLKLFNRICEAVGFAHRNLIVHRDLKPSNILIDANGEPKLLDFGISKMLGETATDGKNELTLIAAMTPEYASPEQIEGKQVTTATDVYSLGVVLYKMLTGALPFDLKGKSSNELFKLIVRQEPPAPSVAAPQTKGDLDNIILKALSKNPERRYQTVEQFSADVWRCVDGLPVTARPATFTYRASKFYRRNKISVIAAALVFLSLFAGIAVAVSQARAARAQANIAFDAQKKSELETEHANAEKERAEKISRFMFQVIAYANPAWYAEGYKFGGEARVIDAVEDLSDKIDLEFAGQPDVQAELHHKFAEVYNFVRRSENDAARKEQFGEKQKFHALRALELRRQFYGERHELVAKDMFYAQSYLAKNERERAEILAGAIEMMRGTNPQNLNLPYMLEDYADNLVLTAAESSGEAYRQVALPPTEENRYALGESYLREAIGLFRFHYKEDNRAILSNECVLAYALARQDKWTDFDKHYQICRQGEAELQRTNLPDQKAEPTILERLEKLLAEKGRK